MLKVLRKTFKQWISNHPLSSVVLGGILLVGFLGTGLFLPGPSRWKGYYLVLLDGKIDLERTILQLKSAGFTDVLTTVTAPITIQSFSHMDNLYLSQLRERLQPEDPRFDGFLSKVERVFQTEFSEAHALYFPIRTHPMFLFHRLASILPEGSYLMVDWALYRSCGLLFLFLLFVAFQTIRAHNHRWIKILGGIPWIPVVLQGSLMGFILSVWTYQVGTNFMDSLLLEIEQYLYYRQSDGMNGILSRILNPVFFTVPILLLMADTSVIVGIIFGSFLSILLGFELILVRIYYLKCREHRIFLPLPILPIHWKETKRGVLYTGLVLLSLAPLLYMLPMQEWKYQVPSPELNGNYWVLGTRTAYRDLWVLHKKDPLPNLSDVIVHVKYQRDFPYGATYDFPSPDEELLYPRFREEGGKLTFWNETIVKYDQTWYKETLHRIKKDKLGNLFYRQGVRTTVWEPIVKRPSGTLLLFYYIVVLLMATSYYRIRMPLMHKPTRWILGMVTRRKQQEA